MPSVAPRLMRRSVAAALGLLILLAAGCSEEPAPGPDAPAAAAGAQAEAAGSPYWVDPRSDAARQVLAWEAQGRNSDAQLLRRISERPMALWMSGGDPAPALRRARAAAKASGQVLLLVAHNIPHRDCGPHSAGGAKDAAAYRAWVGALAGTLADTRAVVVLEPGAVPHVVDGCIPAALREERYGLLSEAVDRLKRNRNTRVYLDAGHPAWIRDPADLVGPLRKAGLARADGFSLNVSQFRPDAASRSYGAEISRGTGGAHFVVDTSRNGAGPPTGEPSKAWCNPPGRSLGVPPTDRTGDPLVDAYLWIKRPGESDGPCRGGPEAGGWWPDHALGLARRARD
ncbi:glycoside hydrolase family 6 protein [Streptomyces sp. NPDC101733]|uniref:glycoside hydrolase family 6 protein n=1 Tax=unclassified Streptomyces TaxID=2593676 RepID=UPI0038073825